jgi:peroxiredoxin Q/BCP
MMPEAGRLAPDFETVDQDGNRHRLSQYRGRPVVLYFYPADDTPGCTREACDFRDRMAVFRGEGAVVLGVSAEGRESHKAFHSKFHLNFPLLVDEDARITRAYGALDPEGFARRVTFLIDGRGVIRRVWPQVRVVGHEAEVAAALHEIKA